MRHAWMEKTQPTHTHTHRRAHTHTLSNLSHTVMLKAPISEENRTVRKTAVGEDYHRGLHNI